jgi:hypothetical protein
LPRCIPFLLRYSDELDVAERYEKPPNPVNPPPWNTAEAAWAFNRYNSLDYSSAGKKAAGLQLALWLILHDEAWRSKCNSASWQMQNSNGGSDLNIMSTVNTNIMGHGTTILNDVYANFENGTRVYYYDPSLGEANYSGAQGFIGEVPEPVR